MSAASGRKCACGHAREPLGPTSGRPPAPSRGHLGFPVPRVLGPAGPGPGGTCRVKWSLGVHLVGEAPPGLPGQQLRRPCGRLPPSPRLPVPVRGSESVRPQPTWLWLRPPGDHRLHRPGCPVCPQSHGVSPCLSGSAGLELEPEAAGVGPEAAPTPAVHTCGVPLFPRPKL